MEITPEEMEALAIARSMAEAGIPIFVCPPNPEKPGRYFYSNAWQHTVADPATVDRWRPGWGIAAVGGHAADFLDMDPRNGGIESQTELKNAGQWPLSFGQQSTPSGGTHDLISASGERKQTAFMPGLDFQAGASEPDSTGSHGRGFVWIAPTVGRSKVTGEPVAYRWVHPPDLDALNEWRSPGGGTSDASIEGIVARVHAKRAVRALPMPARPNYPAPTDSLFMQGSQIRDPFTLEQAKAFLEPVFARLKAAPIGEIEERGMDFTLAIERFVPAFWSVDQAYKIILEGLAGTAYDPNGPSDWTADKFLARLDGRRPPVGSWKAQPRVTTQLAAAAFGQLEPAMAMPTDEQSAADVVDALLSRMLTADQMALKPPPEPLIWDLLDRDTLAGLIGLPGSFKSFVALDLAAHVGSGTPWRGRRVQQGEVVYIVAEGERGMTLRIRAWQKRHGPMPGVRFLPEPVQVRDPMAWQVLIEACRRIQPVMVVVDTQAMVTVGMEENSNNEMGTVIAAFHAIRRATKACVFVVHHTTKAGDSTRGAGAQEGAQDTRLKLERQTPRSSLVVRLKDEKQKDMAEGDDEGIVLQLEPVSLGQDPETGRHLSSLVLVESNAFRSAAGQRDEPEEWETHHGKAQVLLLKVLRDQGGTVGLTKAEARTAVVERFYEGDPKRLAKQTWFTAWTKVMEKVSPDGEPVAVNVSGQRYALDPIAFEGMKALKTDGP